MSDPANLIAIAKSLYRKRDILSLDKGLQDEAVQRLHKFGLLSVSAMASVVGVSTYRVEKAIAGTERPTSRGHLNPAHLTMLMIALSQGDLPPRWVDQMTAEGTSLVTIADLTGISERTLYRRKND